MTTQKVANNPLGSYPVAVIRRASDSSELQIITSGLSIPDHDYISLSYTGANLTGVIYKVNGSSGTTVSTLTLAYSGSDLVSVTKT